MADEDDRITEPTVHLCWSNHAIRRAGEVLRAAGLELMAVDMEAHLPPPPPADYALVLDILERAHGNHPEDHPDLARKLLDGLKELGWEDPNQPHDGDLTPQGAEPAADDDGQCPEWQDAQQMCNRCTMHRGHAGPSHYDAVSSVSWPVGDGVLSDRCPAFRTTAGITMRCGMDEGHSGQHTDTGTFGKWS